MPEIKPLEIIDIKVLSVQIDGPTLIITESDFRGHRVVKRYGREQFRLLLDQLIAVHIATQEVEGEIPAI